MSNGDGLFRKMFFWCGVWLFDSSLKKYGGFNHFLAGKIFRWRYTYMMVSLRREWKLEWVHEDPDYYYDGYHNSLWVGFVLIAYGT